MFTKKHKLIVKSHQPHRQIAVYVALVIVVCAMIFGAYFFGRSKAHLDFDSLLTQRDKLLGENAKLSSDNSDLHEKNIMLKRGSQIEKEGYTHINATLQKLQSEILELKEEVAFYRSIVAPRESSRGIRIQRFEFSSNGDEQSFRYKLVLTQVIKNARITSGHISMNILGIKNGKFTQLPLNDISSAKSKQINFRFRYFQKIDGDVILPEGFVPSRVKLTISDRRTSVEKQFDWPSLLVK